MTTPAPPPQIAERQNPTSGLLALIFGILGFVALPLLGSILALVFGYQSRREVRAQPGQYRDDFGKAGRILGWVGVALAGAGLLVAIALFLFLVPTSVTITG